MSIALPTLKARGSDLASSSCQLRILDALPLGTSFEDKLAESGHAPLRATGIEVLQLNVGKMCNQTCAHCHVDAGPDRTEIMTRETMEHCLRAVEHLGIPTVDITGGAPEMNPHFFWLVTRLRELGAHVIDRCNLTILTTGPHRRTAEFLAEHKVDVVCSLPHCRRPSTDRQRGEGVFDRSIEALRELNALGYGDGTSGLILTIVTNPVGALLPSGQASMEREWKRELDRNFGVRFDRLYSITNMPISRFLDWLSSSGNLEAYMQRLVAAYNPSAAAGVMCRNTLSVSWDGTLYDCDFNQMLELPVAPAESRHIRQFDAGELNERIIVTGRHCFGCTAGAGSSCTGNTV
jgi:radical SAM/Cys-rich protein